MASYTKVSASSISIPELTTKSSSVNISTNDPSEFVTDVEVVLRNFTHSWTSDVDIYLKSPDGKTVMLMSDVGDDSESEGITLTFNDLAPSALTNDPITSGTYRPTDLLGGEFDDIPDVATTGSSLSSFAGSNANGQWTLFVGDDTQWDTGSIGGWDLNVTTDTEGGVVSPPPEEVPNEEVPNEGGVPNDNFSDSQSIEGVTNSVNGSNDGATEEFDEPIQDGDINSVWWSWTAPISGKFTIDTEGSNFDTYLSVFTGDSVDFLSPLGSNDENPALFDGTSLVTINAVAGTTYQIAVDGVEDATGDITLNIKTPMKIGTAGNDNLIGVSSVADTMYGMAGNDTMTGLSGNDQLNGGEGNDTFKVDAGNDILTGGVGSDRFIYDTGVTFSRVAVGQDTITDFVKGQDKIVLDKGTFTKISSFAGNGFSTSSEFRSTNLASAATSSADILYKPSTGELFYNQNGTASGYGTGGKFLTLTNKPLLSASDFVIQS